MKAASEAVSACIGTKMAMYTQVSRVIVKMQQVSFLVISEGQSLSFTAIFAGEYRDGQRSGKSMYTYANGDTYEGEWLRDKMHGRGRFSHANGDVYEVDFVDGAKCGKGKLTLHSGGEYAGAFAGDLFHGKAVFKFPDNEGIAQQAQNYFIR